MDERIGDQQSDEPNYVTIEGVTGLVLRFQSVSKQAIDLPIQ